jgi:outer membrane protein assembly factor BamB
MIRMTLASLILLLTVSGTRAPKTPLPLPDSEFPLLWKADVGRLSFRNNMLFAGNHVIFGSNGSSFRDYWLFDKRSGVYVLNQETGKIVRHFGNEELGDMDVTGILLHNNRFYYGNDNEEFLCTDLNGNIIWRIAASGDVEHEPTLLKTKKGELIVYATEMGEVRAVNPATGKKVWNYYTEYFDGFKEGDSRVAFKVKSYMSFHTDLLRKPELADLNRDGTADLVYLNESNRLIALDGQTGALLWKREEGEYKRFSHLIKSGTGKETYFSVGGTLYSSKIDINDTLTTLDMKGNVVYTKSIPHNLLGESINDVKIGGDTVLYNKSDSLYMVVNGAVVRALPYPTARFESDTDNDYPYNRESLFANRVFAFGKHERCVLLLNQSRFNGSKGAIIEILSLDDGALVRRFILPEDGEMSPRIEDVNNDGQLELLVNCYDGNLYCYTMNGSSAR